MPQITVRDESQEAPAPRAAGRLWTTGRKLMGNLLPFVVATPFAAYGVWRLYKDRPFVGEGLVWMFVAVVVLWLGANFLGLFQNEKLKKAMRRRLESSLRPNEIPSEPVFVGFARPSYRSALDPHEDIGFLLLHADRAEFFGDKERIALAKASLQRVRLRPNPHSWALLGGWVSLEGVLEGKPVRMLLEPREKRTLVGNRRLRRALRSRLEQWLNS